MENPLKKFILILFFNEYHEKFKEKSYFFN